MNRKHLAGNPFQGTTKKVLCVCSAGLLRSPTTAVVLAGDPWNYNTRAAGIYDSALIPVDEVLIHWADEIVCMEQYHADYLLSAFGTDLIMDPQVQGAANLPPILTLGIPDNYEYRNPQLINLIKEAYSIELERILHTSRSSGFGEEQRP